MVSLYVFDNKRVICFSVVSVVKKGIFTCENSLRKLYLFDYT
jgi:hypothetical protein